jgi:hypothetical protein
LRLNRISRHRGQGKHARRSRGCGDIAPPQGFPHIIELLRIIQGKMRRPTSLVFQKLYIDFRNILAFTNDLGPLASRHFVLLEKSSYIGERKLHVTVFVEFISG